MDNGTYRINVKCQNCGEGDAPEFVAGYTTAYVVEIQRGIPVDYHLRNLRCKYCECTTLVRLNN